MGWEEEGLQHVPFYPAFSWQYLLIPPRLRDVTLEAMSPKEATALLEDLGVETDSPEHAQLERSHLCTRASGPRD